MKNKLFKIILLGFFVVLIVGFILAKQYADNRAKCAITTCTLGELREPLAHYYNEHSTFPDNLSLLKFDSNLMIGFKYTNKKNILIEQEKPIRTSFWPWGQKKRYALFKDFSIRNIEK